MKPERKSKILVVNNTTETCDAIQIMLDSFGCKVSVVYASTAVEAIEKLNQEKDIGLVITGIKLDDYTGITLAHHIRKHSNIPIAVLTNYSQTTELTVDSTISFWKRDYWFNHPKEFMHVITKKIKPFADNVEKITLGF